MSYTFDDILNYKKKKKDDDEYSYSKKTGSYTFEDILNYGRETYSYEEKTEGPKFYDENGNLKQLAEKVVQDRSKSLYGSSNSSSNDNDYRDNIYYNLLETQGIEAAEDYLQKNKAETAQNQALYQSTVEKYKQALNDIKSKADYENPTISQQAREDYERDEWVRNNQLEQSYGQALENEYRDVMDEDETKAYNYIYSTQGKRAAEDFYSDTILPILKERVATRKKEANEKFVTETAGNILYKNLDDNVKNYLIAQGYNSEDIDKTMAELNKERNAMTGSIVGSALTVPAGLLSSLELLPTVGNYLSTGKIDTNDSLSSQFTKYRTQTRAKSGQVLSETLPKYLYKDLDEKTKNYLLSQGYGEEDVNNVMAELNKPRNEITSGAINFLYQTGMSTLDSLFNAKIGGGIAGALGAGTLGAGANLPDMAKNISLGLMGTQAANAATIQAKERGLDDKASLILGAIAGMAEIVTERYSLEALFNESKSLATKNVIKFLKENLVAEGAEEGLADVINVAADFLVAQDKSEWEMRIKEYVAQGMSYNEARKMAFIDQASDTALSILGGGLSGVGLGSWGAWSYSNAANNVVNEYGLREGTQGLIDSGLSYNEDTLSNELAQRLQGKVNNNENISNEEIYGLWNANQQSAVERVKELSSELDIPKSAQTTIERLYGQNMEAEDYVSAMMNYYLAGAKNEDIKSVETNVPLNHYQYEEMYRLGKEDNNETRNDLLQSGKRNDGENTGSLVPTMEEDTGRAEERNYQAADREISSVTHGEDISSSELVADGTDRKISVATDNFTSDMEDIVADAKERGLDVTFIFGHLEQYARDKEGNIKLDTNGDKETILSRGEISGKKIIIQVDDPDYTAKQIYEHEKTHSKIAKGEIDKEAVGERIRETGKNYRDIAKEYARAYHIVDENGNPLVDENGNVLDENNLIDNDYILEEMICDAMADMNIFKNRLGRLEQEYAPTYESIKEETIKETNQANAPPSEKNNASDSAEPIKYSEVAKEKVFYTKNGTEVVQNPTTQEYNQMREDILKQYPWLRGTDEVLLRHTYDENGNKYYWNASEGLHSQIEPQINEKYNTRTSQQYEWWKRSDKDDYPVKYSQVPTAVNITVSSDNNYIVDNSTQEQYPLINTHLTSRIKVRTDIKSVNKIVNAELSKLKGQHVVIKSDNRTVYFDDVFSNEYIHSKNTINLRNDVKTAKFNAATKVKEIVENAVNPKWEPNTKPQHASLKKRGIVKYDVVFGYKGGDVNKPVYNIYKGVLVVRMDANGKDYTYDILLDKKIKTVVTPITTIRQQSFVANTVAQQNNNVNTSAQNVSNNAQPVSQAINSSGTSLDQVPALMKDKNAVFEKTNIDIGGGKYETATNYLKSIGVDNMKFDPYNQDESVNKSTLKYLQDGNKADTTTCANVLNVIQEKDARLNVILECAKAVKENGKSYFTVYEGDGSGNGKQTSKGWQNNLKTSEYIDEIETYYDTVTKKGKLIIAENPKSNLPQASWETSPGNATKYSQVPTTDNQGRKLTKGMSEYMKDSKIRDNNGNLLTMYHGTKADFNVFKTKEFGKTAGAGLGIYTISSKSVARMYGSNIKEVYVNITKPAYTTQKNMKLSELQNFIKALCENEARQSWEEEGYDSFEEALRDTWLSNYVNTHSQSMENAYKEAAKEIYNSNESDSDIVREIMLSTGYDNYAYSDEYYQILGEATGIDGLVDTEWNDPDTGGKATLAIPFFSNQVKNVDNENPTKSEDIRFSMVAPVEQKKNLMAIHNLGVDEMLKTIELGGLPMPSIAIVKDEMGHTKYGSISVVFPSDTIDPKKNRYNKVYSGDAYTPEFPHVGYKVDSDRLYEIGKRINNLMGEYKDSFGNLAIDTDNFTDKITRNQGSVVDAYGNNEALKYAYAQDKNLGIEMPMKKGDLSPYMDNDLVEYVSSMFTPEEALKFYQDSLDTYKQFEEDGRLNKVIDKINAWEKKKYADMTLKKGMSVYEAVKTTELPFNRFDNLLGAITKYNKEGIPDIVDRLAYSDAIDKIINDNRADYEKWLKDLFDGAIIKQGIRNQKDVFTSSGNRRSWDALYDEFTLDNIVKAMRGDQQTGKGVLGYSFLGSVHDEYESLDDIRSDKERLQMIDDDTYSEIKQKIWDDVYAIANRIRPSGSWDTLSAVSDIAEAVAKHKTSAGIKRWLSQWYKVSDSDIEEIMELVKQARQIPTGYFEAKPQRAVGLDEILSVVLPNTEKDLINKLKENDIPYKTYKAGDNEDRLKKVNSVKGAKFSQVPMNGTDLAKENRQLKKDLAKSYEEIQKWKSELRISDPLRVRNEDVFKIADAFRKEYSSTYDKAAIRDMFKDLGTFILNASNDKSLSAEEYASQVKAKAVDIASELINSSEEMIVKYPEAEEVRKHLMQGVTISDEDKANIPDFESFRKANFGNIRIKNSGSSVDTVYGELNGLFPHLFPDDITNPADMLLRMAAVAEEIKPTYGNPFEQYGYDVAEIIENVANDIVEQTAYGQMRATRQTFADKQAEKTKSLETKVKDLKEENKALKDSKKELVRKDKVDKMISDLKEKKRQAVYDTKEHYKEKERRARESRQASALRKKIEKKANELSNKLLNPTDKKHITELNRRTDSEYESLRSITAKVLQCINLESAYTTQLPGGGKHSKDGDLLSYVTKRTAAFQELQKEYEKIANTGEFLTDDALRGTDGWLADIAELKDTPIINMGVADLAKIDNCLTSLEYTLKQADHMLTTRKSISNFADRMVAENLAKKEKKVTGIDFIDRLFMGMKTPYTFFHELGDSGDEIYDIYCSGEDKFITLFAEVMDFYQKDIAPYVNHKADEKTMHKLTINGKEVQMSTAALMDMYNAAKRQQALDHVFTGGFRALDTRSNRAKKRTSLKTNNNITSDIIAYCESHLTEENREIADRLQRFMADFSRYGNEASMENFGYEKFTEDSYWPIDVDTNALPTTESTTTESLPLTVGGKGMAKELKPNPQAPVIFKSVYDVFFDHIVDMCEYAAYLSVMNDINRIRNYKYYAEDGSSVTMKQVVNMVHGYRGMPYWTKLMQDLSNGVKSNEEYTAGLLGHFKAVAVGANLRVVAQQPTAIERAAEFIDNKYLLMGNKNPMKGFEKAKKYAPIALWKDWGTFDINMGQTLRSLILGDESLVGKINEKAMKLPGYADNYAWGVLWNAIEYETRAKTDLKVGSEEYYKHVAKKFRKIINRTQVVDSVLQRSEIMRSPSGLVKMSTAFMGEPIKQVNQFMNAIYDYRTNKAKGNTKGNLKRLFRSSVALVNAGILTVLVKTLVDVLRKRDKDKEWGEQYIEELVGTGKNFKEVYKTGNIWELVDIPGYIPYLKDIENAWLGYDIERLDMSVVNDVFKSVNKFTSNLETGKMNMADAVSDLTFEFAKLFGVPASNFKRDVMAISNNLVYSIADATDNPELVYNYYKMFYNVSSEKNKQMYASLLYETRKNGNTEAYNNILNDLKKNGYDDDTLTKAVTNIQKKDQGVSSVKQLENRFVVSPAKQEQYSNMMSTVQNSSVYKKANESQQEYVETTVYSYVKGNDTSLNNTVAKAQAQGISETDWILYTLARKMADQQGDKNGGYNETEKKQAAAMVGISYEKIKAMNKK